MLQSLFLVGECRDLRLRFLQSILRGGNLSSTFSVFCLKLFVFLFVSRDFGVFLFEESKSTAVGSFDGFDAGFLAGDGFFQRRNCRFERGDFCATT